MDTIQKRRFVSRIGISLGKLAMLALIAAYLLLLTPAIGFLGIFILIMVVLLTFGTIFLINPNFGSYFDNIAIFTDKISSFNSYNLYIILGAIALLIVAMVLSMFDTNWQKGRKVILKQSIALAFALLALTLYFVVPIAISK